MNFRQAITAAGEGKRVMRQGWCFLWMYEDAKGILRTRSESGDDHTFHATFEERYATDWMVRPEK